MPSFHFFMVLVHLENPYRYSSHAGDRDGAVLHIFSGNSKGAWIRRVFLSKVSCQTCVRAGTEACGRLCRVLQNRKVSPFLLFWFWGRKAKMSVFKSVLNLPLFRFALVQRNTVEFNQVAMANSEGSEVMLNRVMTKDNIGVAVLLEVKKELFAGGKHVTYGPFAVWQHGYFN